MSTMEFALSVEELAVSLNLIGEARMGHGLMVAQLGAMGREEARARLLAAGHTLLARRLLTVGEQGEITLAPTLEQTVRALANAAFSIRFSRAYRDAELALVYHFANGFVVAQWLEGGVVHRIAEVEGAETVVEGGMGFFQVAKATPFTCPPLEVPYERLSEVKGESDLMIIRRQVAEMGLEGTAGEMLTEDLSKAEYRGTILRVEYGEDRTPYSDRGILVLRGPERLWLFRILPREGEPSVLILPGAEETFRREVRRLVGLDT